MFNLVKPMTVMTVIEKTVFLIILYLSVITVIAVISHTLLNDTMTAIMTVI